MAGSPFPAKFARQPLVLRRFVLRQSTAELWVNDKITATLINRVIPKTLCRSRLVVWMTEVVFGSVFGAIDEIEFFTNSTFETMAQIFYPVDRTHKASTEQSEALGGR